MEILVITDLYPINENEKYTPRTIKNFADSWKEMGHTVKVIKPNFILNSFIRKKTFYRDGIYGNIENLNYFLPFVGNIKKKIKTSLNADIITAHMPSGLIFANRLGLKFCAGVHISDIEVLTNPLYKFYFKPELEKAYENAAKIACRSYALKEKFLSLYPQFENKTFVAPSGIDFEPIKKEWVNREKIRVITCGQFIKRKNIDKVIKACEDFDNIELTVIGSGKEEKFLKSLSKKAIFTGQLKHEEVLKRMRDSDIFILPSTNETFGMVYLEAMASGCITVCTKGDGIDGIIKDSQNGFLTEQSVNEIKDTLNRIINCNNKNEILNHTFQTCLNYNSTKTASDYLQNITAEQF